MIYHVIGLMSGSSLDGLDIVYTELEEIRGSWSYKLVAAECMPYDTHWQALLKNAGSMSVGDFLCLHTAYGRYLGTCVERFIDKHDLRHKIHFIASHGHTIYHNPAAHTSFQLGDGASLAAITGLPVISDLRSLDVALGGQGAPIVPIGDKLLFGTYDYWLNIGGIVNVTVRKDEQLLAWDVCPGNQMLNAITQIEGKVMDKDGKMAAQGKLLPTILEQLRAAPYYSDAPPKSLSNTKAMELAQPVLTTNIGTVNDLSHTAVCHIANNIAKAVASYPHNKEEATMLVTGGGAFHGFLIEKIQEALNPQKIRTVVPDSQTIQYKEAIVMALIGALRWREETNVLSAVTGAAKDSISGTIWMGHSYN